MSAAEAVWAAIFWQPSYGQCFGCSTRRQSVPADYEVWLTTFGPMVSDKHPPESCCQTLCADCTAQARADNTPGSPGGMEVVLVRQLVKP